ncbi:UNVERIFIED_ORG: putative RNA-binding Zn-ribbon protein involved in translation (DUF1610 family) [Arthrobacter sp. UYCu721]
METSGNDNNEETASSKGLVVRTKIASAKLHLEDLRLALPLLSAETMLREMAGRPSLSMEHDEVQQCPACGFNGTSTGVVLSRSGSDHYDGSVTYRNRLGVVRFECSVCGLELVDEAEVMAAGLPKVMEFRTHVYVDGVTVALGTT